MAEGGARRRLVLSLHSPEPWPPEGEVTGGLPGLRLLGQSPWPGGRSTSVTLECLVSESQMHTGRTAPAHCPGLGGTWH